MKAARLMTREVYTVTPSTSLMRAYRLMRSLGVRHLPVLVDRKLCGVLSDRDLLRVSETTPSGEVRFPVQTVATAMTVLPVTARPETSVHELAGMMLEHHINCVPILSEAGELRGLVTSADLLELLRELPGAQERAPVEFRVVGTERAPLMGAA